MTSGQWSAVVRHVQRILQGGAVAGLTEGQLLGRFVDSRDQQAFGALVDRHGPMVLGVCRGVLDDPHDVEDAFQATFLILVRKAGALRDRELLAPWLYGVARKVSLRARSQASLRYARQREGVGSMGRSMTRDDAELQEIRAMVREEVDRLPSNDRTAVVLCYLEGLTHQEAADRLGWPVGTVKGRLARARDRLRDRLVRRGVAEPAGVVASALSIGAGIPLPPPLCNLTMASAIQLASGQRLTAGVVSAQALGLMEGVIRTMFTTKLKLGALAFVATCTLAIPGVVAYQVGGPPDGSKPLLSPAVPSADQVPQEPAEMRKEAIKPAISVEPAPLEDQKAIALWKEAMKKQSKVATDALALISPEVDRNVEPMTSDLYYKWSRRLVEARLSLESSPIARTSALKNHRDRMQRVLIKAKNQADGDLWRDIHHLEAQYRLIEAEHWLAAGRMIDSGYELRLENVDIHGRKRMAPPDLFPPAIKQTPEEEQKTQAILGKLEERVSMPFPNPTPLEDVKKYIEQATQDEAAGLPTGIPIYVDPDGLQAAKQTMASTFSINLEGIPLKTTLRLILRQIGLGYKVEGGLLLITDLKSLAN